MSKSSSVSLKEYLKKYQNEDDDNKKKKKKKSKKPNKATTDSKGVLVVDEDPIWQKPVNLEEDEDVEDSPDEKPQINEDIEVKRMKRMEQIRMRRPYHGISEDGSGWVSVSEHSKNPNSTEEVDDISLPRRTRFDTPSPSPEPENPANSGNNGGEGDHSPPRQKRRRFDSPSPEPDKDRLNSIGIDGDLSPPRRSRSADLRRHDSPDLSPPRRIPKVEESADLSPPRRNSRGLPRTDLSPPRRVRKVEPEDDHSPPRRVSRGSPMGDLSPPRRVKIESADLSLPWRNSRVSPTADLSPPRKSRKIAEARSGLLTAQELKKELDRKKKEELARYKELDPAVSGRAAEGVYRDKEGKRISKDEFLKLHKKEEKPKEKKLEWGKGLAQKREAEAKEHELELEKDKPFARTRDDPELDKMFKDRLRWGDPMAHLVKRKHSDLILEDLGADEKMKESGFMVPQDIPKHSWIIRKIDAPPNRYGIRPGRHWDGVDRSNGYEKQYYKRMNEKQATEREAYLWSVSDM